MMESRASGGAYAVDVKAHLCLQATDASLPWPTLASCGLPTSIEQAMQSTRQALLCIGHTATSREQQAMRMHSQACGQQAVRCTCSWLTWCALTEHLRRCHVV